MRIIFPVYGDFLERDAQRFGVELLSSRGFSVEFWIFDPLFSSPDCASFNSQDLFAWDFVSPTLLTFYSLRDLQHALISVVPNDVIVDPYQILSLSLFSSIDIRCFYGSLFLSSIPHPPLPHILFDSLLGWISSPLRKSRFLLKRFVSPTFQYRPRPLDFALTSGTLSADKFRSSANSPPFLIKTHSFDYDNFLLRTQHSLLPVPDGPYAVFLDEFAPFHPDYERLNCVPQVSADQYYPRLNQFFDRLEDKLRLTVVIAAHPKSTYSPDFSPFGGRHVFRGLTLELIHSSVMVLLHSSTAVSYSVLYKKPLIFLDSTFYQHAWRRTISLFANELQSPLLSIDHPSPTIPVVECSPSSVLASYIARYIKEPGTPDRPIWDIFADAINCF